MDYPPKKMALTTSDLRYNVLPAHQAALITSGCKRWRSTCRPPPRSAAATSATPVRRGTAFLLDFHCCRSFSKTVPLPCGLSSGHCFSVGLPLLPFLLQDSVFTLRSSSGAHLVVAVDGPGQSINTFLDGQTVPAQTLGHVPMADPVNPRLDWTMTSQNLAYPDPTHLTGPLGPFVLAGGSLGPILGNDRAGGSAGFLGSMTFVTLWSKAMSQNDAACLFTWQNQHVEVCEQPNTESGQQMSGTVWHEDLTKGTGIRDDVKMGFSAWIDPGYGMTMDGAQDFMAISPAPQYTDDGTFSISFWYTRTQCTVPGSYEALYSQHQSWVTGAVGSRGSVGASIDLTIGCGSSTDEDSLDGSTIAGSRRREFCHFHDTPCLSLLKHLPKVQGGVIK